MQRLKQLFGSRLALRIWVYTVVPVVLVLVGVNFVLAVYFNRYRLDDAVAAGDRSTRLMANALSENWRNMLQGMVFITASADFHDQSLEIMHCTPADYTDVSNSVQQFLTEYTRSSSLLQTAVVLKTGRQDGLPMLFASYAAMLHTSPSEFLQNYDYTGALGLTLLPVTDSPLRNRDQVLPLVVPLQMVSNILQISTVYQNADIVLYLFLDASTVQEYLELYSDDALGGTLYLASRSGANISIPQNDVYSAFVEQTPYLTALTDAIEAGDSHFLYQDHYVYFAPIGFHDLYAVDLVPEENFYSGMQNLQNLFLMVALTSIVVITVVCLLISLLVTKPVRSLMATVQDIEKGVYDGSLRLHGRDELAQLERALCKMDQTIRDQIVVIKQEQRDRSDAQMQMLTEQINPHFLYNTLEFINMEIYSRHPENASHMISRLGEYIRICLSGGDTEIELGQELEHMLIYTEIMGYRFNQDIDVQTHVDEDLCRCRILKCILQPLVENSLKHGFKTGSGQTSAILPRIEVNVTLTEEELQIVVLDNGEGIDIARAQRIMHTKVSATGDKHLGLNNIYSRLQSRYGDAKMEFASIPYFENTVTIRLPAESFRKQLEEIQTQKSSGLSLHSEKNVPKDTIVSDPK